MRIGKCPKCKDELMLRNGRVYCIKCDTYFSVKKDAVGEVRNGKKKLICEGDEK